MHRLEDYRLTTDRDAPYFYQQYMMIQRENQDAGLARMEGLDLPYPHRIGSSVCCPDHPQPRAPHPLPREAPPHEAPDQRRGARLARSRGPEDESAARRILVASDNWCGDGLIEWEQRAKQEAEERRKRRGKGKRRSTASADKAKRLRAVRASMGHTRAQVIRSIAKDAKERAR